MGAKVFVYCPNGEGLGLSDLEDLLEGFFGDAARLFGAYQGDQSFNLDFELADDQPLEQWVEQLRAFLREAGVRPKTWFEAFESGWVQGTGMECHRVEIFGRHRRYP